MLLNLTPLLATSALWILLQSIAVASSCGVDGARATPSADGGEVYEGEASRLRARAWTHADFSVCARGALSNADVVLYLRSAPRSRDASILASLSGDALAKQRHSGWESTEVTQLVSRVANALARLRIGSPSLLRSPYD